MAQQMADDELLWQRMTAKYGLEPIHARRQPRDVRAPAARICDERIVPW